MRILEEKLLELKREVNYLKDTKLGSAKYPSYKEAMEIWKDRCKSPPARSFRNVIEVKTDLISHLHGFEVLGYKENVPKTTKDFVRMHHEDIRLLADYYAQSIYKTALLAPGLFQTKGLEYSSLKGMADAHGQYWYVQQVSEPFRFDENGYMTSYLTHYQIIKEYNNQPLETCITLKNKDSQKVHELEGYMKNVKKEILSSLGFTERQQEVLFLEAKGNTPKEIAELFGITSKAVYNHRTDYTKHANFIFPEHNFKNPPDVVIFLKKQQLI